eukprot:11197555-Lingulodinium_polyedra.AAC.1
MRRPDLREPKLPPTGPNESEVRSEQPSRRSRCSPRGPPSNSDGPNGDADCFEAAERSRAVCT